jgi:hypothetical protein
MISHQEHEAWDVLLACQGQLRVAPSGQVIGIDMNAALRLASARGHDLAVLSELLPAAEAGLVEALCQQGLAWLRLNRRHQCPLMAELRSLATDCRSFRL